MESRPIGFYSPGRDERIEKIPESNKIIFGNIRGIKPLRNTTKIDFLSDYINICDSSIICLTESHLRSEIGDGEINLQDYTKHRCDRERLKGGGTIIYTKNCIKASKCLEWKNNQCELVGVQVKELNTNVNIHYFKLLYFASCPFFFVLI